jgi:hypothetical protein
MQDMDEMAVRAALRRVVSADEPPVGALVGESLRAGLKLRRRRRLQAAGGCLAVVAALAAGVPAVATALGSAPPATAPAGPAAGGGPGPRVHVALPAGFHMVPPAVPAQILAGRQVPVTAKSIASLLLAVLPAGQRANHLALAAATPRNRSAVASVDVETLRTTGSVVVQMGRPAGARLLSCATARAADGAIVACRDYSVPGGTEVQELVLAAGVGSGNGVAEGFSYVFAATVRRADGVSVMVQASNYVPGPASLPPLTMAQVVTAAADPRWSWTMDSTFVAQARQVRLTALAPMVCAQVHPADPNC